MTPTRSTVFIFCLALLGASSPNSRADIQRSDESPAAEPSKAPAAAPSAAPTPAGDSSATKPATAAPSMSESKTATAAPSTPESKPTTAAPSTPDPKTVTAPAATDAKAAASAPAAADPKAPPPPVRKRADGPKPAGDPLTLKARAAQAEVDALKLAVFRSKARLRSLQAALGEGEEANAHTFVTVVFVNEMGSGFALERARFLLDGALVLERQVDKDGKLDAKGLTVFDGGLASGPHELSVALGFRATGGGVLAYLSEYTYKATASFTFDAKAGKMVQIRVTAFEKGTVLTALKDRPAIKFDQTLGDLPSAVTVSEKTP